MAFRVTSAQIAEQARLKAEAAKAAMPRTREEIDADFWKEFEYIAAELLKGGVIKDQAITYTITREDINAVKEILAKVHDSTPQVACFGLFNKTMTEYLRQRSIAISNIEAQKEAQKMADIKAANYIIGTTIKGGPWQLPKPIGPPPFPVEWAAEAQKAGMEVPAGIADWKTVYTSGSTNRKPDKWKGKDEQEWSWGYRLCNIFVRELSPEYEKGAKFFDVIRNGKYADRGVRDVLASAARCYFFYELTRRRYIYHFAQQTKGKSKDCAMYNETEKKNPVEFFIDAVGWKEALRYMDDYAAVDDKVRGEFQTVQTVVQAVVGIAASAIGVSAALSLTSNTATDNMSPAQTAAIEGSLQDKKDAQSAASGQETSKMLTTAAIIGGGAIAATQLL